MTRRPAPARLLRSWDDVARAAYAKLQVRREATIRRMLGQWVSGLDPVVVYGSDGEPLGLIPASEHAPGLIPPGRLQLTVRATKSPLPWEAGGEHVFGVYGAWVRP